MDQRLIDLIQLGRETRNIEYKRTYSWNDPSHKAKIVKTILAMSNIRDGGYLILGVEENNGSFTPVGVPQADYDLLNTDDVLAFANRFADPYVEIKLHKGLHEGMLFVVVEVQEFQQYPVVCKCDGLENLKCGSIYTRTRRMYESAVVPSQTEMREIIEMAVDKGIREFNRRVSYVGLSISGQLSATEQYDQELGGL